MSEIKTGALTQSELMTVWQSVTDPEYSRPFIETEGSLIEVIEQAAVQLAEVSAQVDANTQSMFILPWSGQTAPPAAGGARAQCTLTLTRTAAFHVPLVFGVGDIVVEHRLNDYSKEGPANVTTGRRYAVLTTTAFGVGQAGPIDLVVTAENEGEGYNVPTPGTLTTIVQPGSGFSNGGASVIPGPGNIDRVITVPVPDVPIPEHRGQYLQFVAGANTGRIVRIVNVENPNPNLSIPHGGVFVVACEAIFKTTSIAGTFRQGEQVAQTTTGAQGVMVVVYGGRLVVRKTFGTFSGTHAITGLASGAVATISAKEQSESLVPEDYSAGWRILDWSIDLGVVLTNAQQPTGGRAAMLDALGGERKLPRLSREEDDPYRLRVATLADTISPAALQRAANRVLAPYFVTGCLREVGTEKFPGMFDDAGPSQKPFADDLDIVRIGLSGGPGRFARGERVRAVNSAGLITTGYAQFRITLPAVSFYGATRIRGPQFEVGSYLEGEFSGERRLITNVSFGLNPAYRFYLDLTLDEFRGFFLMGVPRLVIKDFGFFDDAGSENADDANTLDNFDDGHAIGTNSVYSQIWQRMDATRMAGVGFDIYIEDFGCV